MADNKYCVPGFDFSTDVTLLNGKYHCHCKSFVDFGGLCHHCLIVDDSLSSLASYLTDFNRNDNTLNQAISARINRKAGEKPKVKKVRRSKNGVESMPIVTDVDADDNDVDFAKPVLQKEVWHNENPLSIVFVAVYKDKEKKHFSHMKSSEPKQIAYYYCIDKGCLLKRHPYFWKGMVRIDDPVKAKLKNSHKTFIYKNIRYKVE